MPVAFRLYLPESWVADRERRKKTRVPKSIQFQTKPEIALEQIRRARLRPARRCCRWPMRAIGNDSKFRGELTKLEMSLCSVGVTATQPASGNQGKDRRPRSASTEGQHRTAAPNCCNAMRTIGRFR